MTMVTFYPGLAEGDIFQQCCPVRPQAPVPVSKSHLVCDGPNIYNGVYIGYTVYQRSCTGDLTGIAAGLDHIWLLICTHFSAYHHFYVLSAVTSSSTVTVIFSS